jgi:hypothetical protein
MDQPLLGFSGDQPQKGVSIFVHLAFLLAFGVVIGIEQAYRNSLLEWSKTAMLSI